ncbi:twin-arginine translocase TatA/TatE family subunit [Leucobacter sp. Z1108]|uniref:twin-arginine translocase TatA/TatE family subunit n=1 Tax=Leucobacter sp. Z1108 TaxID=3439066 RepID=UPI000E9618CB|nr:twin-arginine translocase TatA/TatE family subunit [Leucobacter sp.]HBX76448.1 preprotein translocase [Acidimicrobiaceae bacterium]
MLGNLNGPTLLVIIFLVLLLFGAPRLPSLARSIGQSMRILKKEMTVDADTSGSVSAPDEENPRP